MQLTQFCKRSERFFYYVRADKRKYFLYKKFALAKKQIKLILVFSKQSFLKHKI